MSKKLFVTGTGTDVGKTYISALILKKLAESKERCAYYKAAMSGNELDADGKTIPGDALYVKNISGIEQPVEDMCRFVYKNALSPHLASKLEGNPVNMDSVMEGLDILEEKYDYITGEGSGGIFCPLDSGNRLITLEDFIIGGNFPCVIVADAGLGTLNSIVLTVSYMKSAGIPVKGLILNNFIPGNIMHEDNRLMCEKITGIKVIACVQKGQEDIDIDADFLKSLYD